MACLNIWPMWSVSVVFTQTPWATDHLLQLHCHEINLMLPAEQEKKKISYGPGFFTIPLFVLLLRSRSRATRSRHQTTVQLVGAESYWCFMGAVLNVFLDHLSNFMCKKLTPVLQLSQMLPQQKRIPLLNTTWIVCFWEDCFRTLIYLFFSHMNIEELW